jgi:amidase
VPPFDVKLRYATEINGIELGTYIDWMRSCYYITATGLSAISVPCSFTPERLPMGVLIVSRHRDDTWGCCSWPTPSSRKPASGSRGRR